MGFRAVAVGAPQSRWPHSDGSFLGCVGRGRGKPGSRVGHPPGKKKRMSMGLIFWKRKLNKLESLLVSELCRALAPASAEILSRQLGDIDHVRRLSCSREVLCYRKKSHRRSAPPFPARNAELKFATIHFIASESPAKTNAWTADFYLVNGYFFSIVFTPTPKGIRDVSSVKVQKVDVLADLSTSIPLRLKDTKSVARDLASLPEWATRLERRLPISDLREPLDSRTRTELLEAISAALPEDYLQLVEATEGMIVGNVSVLGLAQVYEVVMPDWNYYLIAELHSVGALAVRAHSTEPILYFLDYSGGKPVEMGRSLAHAIERLRLRPKRE